MKKTLFIVIAAAFIGQMAHAVNENNLLEKADELNKHYIAGADGYFPTEDGIELHYHMNRVNQEKGTVVLVMGRGETTAKYAELIFDLNNSGFSVFTYDLRGQGLSGGRLKDHPERNDVADFHLYVSDLDALVANVVLPSKPKNLYLLTQSSGGVIGSLYMAKHPQVFKSAVLVSPAFGLNTGHSDAVVKAAKCLVGPTVEYARGAKDDFDPNLPFDNNKYTNSSARFTFARAQLNADPASTVGGPTNRWLCTTLDAGVDSLATAGWLNLPIFVAKADNDLDVRIKDEEAFCEKAKNCHSQLYHGKHELLMEKDEIREPLYNNIISSFSGE